MKDRGDYFPTEFKPNVVSDHDLVLKIFDTLEIVSIYFILIQTDF